MSVDEYFAWLETQPEGARYELMEGTPVAMAPERASHARLKARVWQALDSLIAADGLACEVFPDGMTIRIDDHTAYEPDVVLRCGELLTGEAVVVPDPLLIVEVLSRSARGRDAGAKLADYFRLPSVVHYLLVETDRPIVIHHVRGASGDITTRIVTGGSISLDPPGIELDLRTLYTSEF